MMWVKRSKTILISRVRRLLLIGKNVIPQVAGNFQNICI